MRSYNFNMLILLLIFFIGGCGSSKLDETVTIYDSDIENVTRTDGNIQIDFIFRVSKNVKTIRVYYDRWENEWIRLNYSSWQDVPGRDRRTASQIVSVRDSLTVSQNTERVRATIIASNISFEEGFGVSAEKQEIFSIEL